MSQQMSQIEDGVYIGMSADQYHSASALGSTDLKKLAASPPDWWHSSNRNSDREPDDKPAFVCGRALHTCVLEGHAAFGAAYVPLVHPGNTKAGKDERAAAEASGLIGLKRDDFARILAMHEAVEHNPHLAHAVTGGVAEVSVFWTDEATGVRLKCRFDYLKRNAIVDLKSIRPTRPGPFDESCIRAIGEFRYHAQAAHYCEGRRELHRAVAEGRVYGSTNDGTFDDANRGWLAHLSPAFAFVFLFVQAEGAPLTWGTMLSPDNGALENGGALIRCGIEAYRECVARFGEDAPWLDHAPLEELDMDRLPRWSLA